MHTARTHCANVVLALVALDNSNWQRFKMAAVPRSMTFRVLKDGKVKTMNFPEMRTSIAPDWRCCKIFCGEDRVATLSSGTVEKLAQVVSWRTRELAEDASWASES